jgi:hypothetical protein
MNPDAQQELVGYDRRQLEVPLRCREIKFGDSKIDVRLQVADLIASTCNYWARGLIDENKQDDLWHELNKLELTSIEAGAVWPSTDVSPTDLGTDSGLGNNPIASIAKHWSKV